MSWISLVEPFGVTIGLLGLGLPIILFAEMLGRKWSLHPALIALPVFIVYNCLASYFLGLQKDLRLYWRPQGIKLFFFGSLLGSALGLLPILLSMLIGQTISSHQQISTRFSSLALTLCTVCWEESWFRGIPLNYLARNRGPIVATLFSSVIFAGVHAFNPEMHLWEAAPNLFLASVLLAFCYVYFQSIYFPIGVHFAWNAFHDSIGPMLLKRELPSNWLWGENGVVTGVMLASGCFFFYRRVLDRSKNDASILGTGQES
jgi:membrane protease YdiL (CAAX protease family)